MPFTHVDFNSIISHLLIYLKLNKALMQVSPSLTELKQYKDNGRNKKCYVFTVVKFRIVVF
jgi:hypothetical protein